MKDLLEATLRCQHDGFPSPLTHHPWVTQALWGLTPPRLQPVPSSLYELIREEYALEHALPLACERVLGRGNAASLLLCVVAVHPEEACGQGCGEDQGRGSGRGAGGEE